MGVPVLPSRANTIDIDFTDLPGDACEAAAMAWASSCPPNTRWYSMGRFLPSTAPTSTTSRRRHASRSSMSKAATTTILTDASQSSCPLGRLLSNTCVIYCRGVLRCAVPDRDAEIANAVTPTRLPGLRRRQPHVRDEGRTDEVRAPGVRGRDRLRRG